MSEQSNKSWLDSLSEILNSPLPGTETASEEAGPAAEAPVVFSDDDDDDTLLDRITEVLSKPLPGTGPEDKPEASAAPGAGPENPGEQAVKKASEEDAEADPVSTTGAAGADWMQREYERFNQHQERNRQAFAARQKVEQERFFAYQRQQLEGFTHSQERERQVFRQHQEGRFQAWRQDLRKQFGPPPGGPGQPMPGRSPAGPGMHPGMLPPPPPPWWRRR